MFTYKNLMTVCCAAVLALGLAACGSSDDDKTATVTPPGTGDPPAPPGPTPDEIVAETKAAGTKVKAITAVEPDNAGVTDVTNARSRPRRAGPEISVEGADEFTQFVAGRMYSLMHEADIDDQRQRRARGRTRRA